MTIEPATLPIVLVVIAVFFVYTLISGNSPVPTSPRVKAVVLDSIPADVDGTIYELGSGWGTLAIPLARRYPDLPVVAFEISPLPWLFSKAWQAFASLSNLTIRRADFRDVSLADAALVVCYLFPAAMDTLRTKFEAELGPGTVVVSNFFAIRGWEPESVRTAGDLYNSKVYVYRVPG